LQIIPPTIDRIQAMIDIAQMEPDAVIGSIPERSLVPMPPTSIG
jgi:hypothetical protein